jgi:hypothetical protein
MPGIPDNICPNPTNDDNGFSTRSISDNLSVLGRQRMVNNVSSRDPPNVLERTDKTERTIVGIIWGIITKGKGGDTLDEERCRVVIAIGG